MATAPRLMSEPTTAYYPSHVTGRIIGPHLRTLSPQAGAPACVRPLSWTRDPGTL